MHGVEVGELRLPKGASVSLIVRDGTTLVPQDRTVLRHGDELLVVTPRRIREKTEERLRAVSLGGRLAQWLRSDPHEMP
jgi:cell volume regulation protein A